MKRATLALGMAAAGTIAGLWWLAVAHHPERASTPSPLGDRGAAETRSTATPGVPRAAPSRGALPTESGAVTRLEQPTGEERAARELAREPIEAQPLDVRERHHQASAEALLHSRNRQRETIAQLEAERAEIDPSLRPALEEAIRVRQNLLQERERQAETAVSNTHSAP